MNICKFVVFKLTLVKVAGDFESLHVLNTSWGFNLTTRHSTAQVATGFDSKILFWYPFPTQDSSCVAIL